MVVKSATKKKLMDIGVNELDAHVLSDDRKWDDVSALGSVEIAFIIQDSPLVNNPNPAWRVYELLEGAQIDKRPDPQIRATRIHHLIMLSRLLHPNSADNLDEWIHENLDPTYRFLINNWDLSIATIDPTDYVNEDLIDGLLPGDTKRITDLFYGTGARAAENDSLR
jgi:hypothetical protein